MNSPQLRRILPDDESGFQDSVSTSGDSSATREPQPTPVKSGTDASVRRTIDPHKTTMIPPGAVVRGEIIAESLYLAGTVEGSVHVKQGTAVIAATGLIKGSLEAEGSVTLAGRIEGEGVCVRAKERLDIGAEASITGDVEYSRIIIREGARIEGRLSILKPV